MKKLLDFLLRKKHWFLFVIFEVISIILVYQNNSYQRSVLINSGNVVSGYLGSVYGDITSYFNLKEVNRSLQEMNGEMELKILQLQEQIDALKADTVQFVGTIKDSVPVFPFQFIMAEVSNNSFVQLSNYITLNKGSVDGIKPDMGVVSEKGVVGIVATVSDHFSVVIPILNPKSRLSCKVLGNNNFGYLSWDGRDPLYATLEELPKHSEFKKGDIIVTSGYSSIFPPGIIVGTVEEFRKGRDDNYYSLKVKLATTFTSLQHVRVISNYRQEEQIYLEKEAKRND